MFKKEYVYPWTFECLMLYFVLKIEIWIIFLQSINIRMWTCIVVTLNCVTPPIISISCGIIHDDKYVYAWSNAFNCEYVKKKYELSKQLNKIIIHSLFFDINTSIIPVFTFMGKWFIDTSSHMITSVINK